ELSGLSGLSFRGAGLVLRRGGKRVLERSGDLLITHEGLSGPLVLDCSRDIEKGDLLEIRYPWEGIAGGISQGRAQEELAALLDEAVLRGPRLLVRTALSSAGLPRALSQYISGKAGLPEDATLASLSRVARRELTQLVTAFPLTVSALGGVETAMVTAGGIDLASVDSASMESRLVPGLFFAGEILDYDGDTGGYNLHAAFATAALAAAAIAGRSPG
ncbi:MAG: NAD(P)/FAD-dependent oxidoreductase, partial [Spirochaetota bacterium]